VKLVHAYDGLTHVLNEGIGMTLCWRLPRAKPRWWRQRAWVSCETCRNRAAGLAGKNLGPGFDNTGRLR
jgi:hypothetical protein